jgi:2-acylglycerol O-acyltransferase 2
MVRKRTGKKDAPPAAPAASSTVAATIAAADALGPPRFEVLEAPRDGSDPHLRAGEAILWNLTEISKAEIDNPLDHIPGYQGPSAARDDRMCRLGTRSLDRRFGAAHMQKLETMTFAEEAQTVGMFLVFFGSFFLFPTMFVALLLLYGIKYAAACACVGVLLNKCLPIQRWPPFLLTRNMRYLLCKYFSLKIVVHEILDTKTPWVLCAFPHGVFPIANILSMVLVPILRGLYYNGLGATALLAIPLAGNMLGMMGMEDCSKANVRQLMMKEKRSVALLPGGITEIFYTSQEQECIYIKKRKGFVKLALQAGHPIVPIYSFGNTDLLHCLTGKILETISNVLHVSVTTFWGRWGLPVPFRKPVVIACGMPIRLPTIAEPSNAEINYWHQKVIDGTIEVFETHKADFGWAHKTLHVC